jgi:hypothetical protein
MRAVWSFWSLPFHAGYHRVWSSMRHHLMSWALSVGEATKHYPDTCLCTDSAGAALLVEQLGLRFRNVDLRLDALGHAGRDSEWWVLGKLTTYAAQTEPFLHLDSDVFLWKPLPARMTAAAVLVQNPEVFYFEDASIYRLDRFMAGIARGGGWLPEEWRWYAARRRNRALCCGIIGGQDTIFLRHYAQSAIEVITHPANQPVWPTLGVRDNILVEQYFLAACLAYHRQHRPADYSRLNLAALFASAERAFDPDSATKAGYTHLIGEAKSNWSIAQRLEQRLRRDYPAAYERCLAISTELQARYNTDPCANGADANAQAQ